MSTGQVVRLMEAGENLPLPCVDAPQPNEFDQRRITRLLAQRARYRYVEPEVQSIADGYLVVSPCCSRNVDASGGTIDIARLEYAHLPGRWRLYCKDHQQGVWKLHSESPLLQKLIDRLNADPTRVFWQ